MINEEFVKNFLKAWEVNEENHSRQEAFEITCNTFMVTSEQMVIELKKLED